MPNYLMSVVGPVLDLQFMSSSFHRERTTSKSLRTVCPRVGDSQALLRPAIYDAVLVHRPFVHLRDGRRTRNCVRSYRAWLQFMAGSQSFLWSLLEARWSQKPALPSAALMSLAHFEPRASLGLALVSSFRCPPSAQSSWLR